MYTAQKNPIKRPADPNKLKYRPKALKTKIGLVTIPDSESLGSPDDNQIVEQQKEPTAHTEMQALLLQLGGDMGFDIWVAKNDRNRSYNGLKFADFPLMRDLDERLVLNEFTKEQLADQEAGEEERCKNTLQKGAILVQLSRIAKPQRAMRKSISSCHR